MALFLFCIFSEKNVVVDLTQFGSPDIELYFRKDNVENTSGFRYTRYLGRY